MVKSKYLVLALVSMASVGAVAAGCGDSGSGSSSGTSGTVDLDSGTVTPTLDSGTKTDSGTTPTKFKVTASVVGLKGPGLVLADKSGATVTVNGTAGGAAQTITLLADVPAQTSYAITVKTQPTNPVQLCTVTGGTGTVAAGDVTSITVNCADGYTLGGTVTGLDGKDLILENAGGTPSTVTVNANGQFAFPTPLLMGASYSVTVKQNPTAKWQTCVLANADGTGAVKGSIAGGNVTSLAVTCTTNKYAVKGTVTGLDGDGFTLQNSGGDDLTLLKGATTFAFATSVASGSAYAVTVKTKPSNRTQDCVITNGTGNVAGADVSNVSIACTTSKYKIGGTISGLAGGTNTVLQNNAGDDLTVSANGNFTFVTSVNSGDPYAVTVKTQPVGGVICSVSTGTGTVAAADVTSVVVTCSADCKTVNGVLWCRDPGANACGEPCNTVCAKYGKVPEDDAKVLAAQNTVQLCTALRDAYGINQPVSVSGYTYGCAEQEPGGNFVCSNYSGCPLAHRTQCDAQGNSNCAQAHRSICGCK